MKRDMDLIRAILLHIEEYGDPAELKVVPLHLEGYDPAIVEQHAKLLKEAGYIRAHDVQVIDGIKVLPLGLTWQGHEFVDAARNTSAWNSVQKKAQEYGGSLPIEMTKRLLLKSAGAKLGILE